MVKNSELKTQDSVDEKKAFFISVRGDVQGVFYRHFTKKEADMLGIVGWCRNEVDGSVKIFCQGEEESLEKFIEWTKIGSPMAVVESVEVEEVEANNSLKGFEIK